MTTPIGTWVVTVETRRVGKVIEHDESRGELMLIVMFVDPILLAFTRNLEEALCEEDVGWYVPEDVCIFHGG